MFQIKNILYLGWIGKGNVGDDVLFELFKYMFYKYHEAGDSRGFVNIDAYPIVQDYKIDLSAYDLIVLGGGSLLHLSYWLNICAEGMRHKIPVVSWGTGFDGSYQTEDFDAITLPQQQADQFRAIYHHFDYMSVRGRFTKKMLTNIGVTRPIDEIGDPALIYAAETISEPVKAEEHNRKILINWGTSYNHIFGANELAVENALVTVIQVLLSKGYSITIYPIWINDIMPVKRLGEKVNDSRCQVQTEVYEAKILQEMISKSYLSINLKLHANILSAAANRPFISLAYRGKCFDFTDTVDCLDYTVATDSVTSEHLLHLVQHIERDYSEIVDRFNVAKAKYHPKLIRSIRVISRLLH